MAAMLPIFVLLTSATLAVSAEDFFGTINSFSKGLRKEAAAVAHPVESGFIGALSSQCGLVKRTLGLQYEQLKNDKEPDLNKLTLEFRDRIERIIFELLTAHVEIPKSRIYHPNEKLIIFIHGFTDDPTKEGFGKISAAFNEIGTFNVLALDGSSLIKWLYLRSTTYIRFMGEKLGEMLASMTKSGLNPSKIHIIGHSLGAHISGFAGKTFTQLTGQRVGRISALDPAGPCFIEVDENLRLKKTDADFVDVVHTDAGVLGLSEPVGHVDFYPNGGNKQPGCLIPGCGHSRAWLYYAESVTKPEAFPARKCDDWERFKNGQCEDEIRYMGLSCDATTRGQFFLQTGEESPYGLGVNGTAYTDNAAVVDKLYSRTKSFLPLNI